MRGPGTKLGCFLVLRSRKNKRFLNTSCKAIYIVSIWSHLICDDVQTCNKMLYWLSVSLFDLGLPVLCPSSQWSIRIHLSLSSGSVQKFHWQVTYQICYIFRRILIPTKLFANDWIRTWFSSLIASKWVTNTAADSAGRGGVTKPNEILKKNITRGPSANLKNLDAKYWKQSWNESSGDHYKLL